MSNVEVRLFTAEAFVEVKKLLKTVGLNDRYGFDYAVQDVKNYNHGSLEWSERGFGSRFYFTVGHSGRIRDVKVVNLDHRGPALSESALETVNASLRDVIGRFNR